MIERRRRLIAVLIVTIVTGGIGVFGAAREQDMTEQPAAPVITKVDESQPGTTKAREVLGKLTIKGRAPKTGYTRAQFGDGWAEAGNCNVRNAVLARDLTEVQTRSAADCTVTSGTLHDPYTNKVIAFTHGAGSSSKVQIDHVVALSDAWQKGAQQLSGEDRIRFANDPLNLLAVDGPANQQKSDGDAATWLPPNKPYRCLYVARQIAVKQKYVLWVTQAEHDAISRVLEACPEQSLPLVIEPR